MKLIPFSEAAKFVNGRAFKPEEWKLSGLPIIRIQNLTGSTNIINYCDKKVEDKFYVTKGDILISWSASLGVYIWEGNNGVLNQHIFKVIPKPGVDKAYFYYAATNVLHEMQSKVHGSTMQHITKDPFESTLIPLPPLPEQQHIAAILQQADRIRKLRRYSLQLSQSFLQSAFIQMFGDPVSNPKGWELVPLKEVCKQITDGTHKTPTYISDGVPFISTVHISENGIDWVKAKRISKDEFTILNRRCNPEYGDLLYTKVGSVGFAFPILENYKFSIFVQLALLKVDNTKMDFQFLSSCLNNTNYRNKVVGRLSGATMKYIGTGEISRLKVIYPPREVQQDFANIVKSNNSLIDQQMESSRQSELLFQSLLHRAFSEQL